MIFDPNCQICRHEKRLQIDLSVQVQGQRATSKQYGVSRQSIQRHLDKEHSDNPVKPPPGTKIEPIAVTPREIPDKEPLVEPSLAYDGVDDTQPDEAPTRVVGAEPKTTGNLSKRHKKRKRCFNGRQLGTGFFESPLTNHPGQWHRDDGSQKADDQ